jgi:stage IV sporulation protein A
MITRLMNDMVIAAMPAGPKRDRITDELPQSGSGRTIMTTQPKFVPGEAATLSLSDQLPVRVRMVDSVGYLVEGALGTDEEGASRMVHTPWFDHDIPFEQAAEIGTRKVITDHATIGLVVTTDGSIAELPREAYAAPEERVVRELRELGKPFIVVLNSRTPEAKETQNLSKRLGERYGVPVMAVNVREMELSDILDKEDYISEGYILEVSSPGLLRPLKKIRDFARNLGKDIEVKTYKAVGGEKEFVGTLASYEEGRFTIETEKGPLTFETKDTCLIRPYIEW